MPNANEGHREPAENAHLGHFALMAHIDRAIAAAIHKHELENARQIEQFEREVNALKLKLAEVEKLAVAGYPNDDPFAHRRVHEHYIDEAREREAMLRGTKHKVVELTTWAAVLLVANALWDYVRTHLK